MVAILFLLLTLVYYFAMGNDWGYLKWGPVAVFALVALVNFIVVFRIE